LPALSQVWGGVRRDRAATTISVRENAAMKIMELSMMVNVTVNRVLAY
jgi:hypothetical protein